MGLSQPSNPPAPAVSLRPLTAPSAINREAAGMPSAAGSVDVWRTQSGGAEGPTEIVIRPKGLRHGIWEAPKWAFWSVAGIIVVAAIVYALVRTGVIHTGGASRRKAR